MEKHKKIVTIELSEYERLKEEAVALHEIKRCNGVVVIESYRDCLTYAITGKDKVIELVVDKLAVASAQNVRLYNIEQELNSEIKELKEEIRNLNRGKFKLF